MTGSNNLATQTVGLPSGVSATTTAALALGSLASNGGPTQTLALSAGSSAIAAGTTATTATFDQRGVARPVNAPGDVGAYQSQFIVGSTTTVTLDAAFVSGSVSYDGTPHGATASWASSGSDGAARP